MRQVSWGSSTFRTKGHFHAPSGEAGGKFSHERVFSCAKWVARRELFAQKGIPVRQVGASAGTFRTKECFHAPSKGREATQLAIAQASCLKQLRELCLKAHSACFMPCTPRFLFWGEVTKSGWNVVGKRNFSLFGMS